MPYVTQDYYTGTYYGEAVPADQWDRYYARAAAAIDQITRYRVATAGLDSFPAAVQMAVQTAVCAQIEYYVDNGIDTAQSGVSAKSYTLGRIHVSGGSGNKTGSYTMISPAAFAALEQTGLLNAQVGTYDAQYLPYPLGGIL